ncbi:MAG: hypothetical protein WC729_09885 [Sphingomonas sp.]|jgi:hypothetical protein|uniref:hypothetical protein n=1 Tax=Sphingomonas sp. TaxID=28214 RepID=UPI003562E619
MRAIVAIGMVAMLCSCSTFDRPNEPPYPPREASTRKPPREPKVERWTQQQRDCEVGDRKDQRRCIMPYPDE